MSLGTSQKSKDVDGSKCVYIYIYVYIYMYACMYVCMSVCLSVRPSVCMYIHTYIHTCMHTYIHVYIYIYTYICVFRKIIILFISFGSMPHVRSHNRVAVSCDFQSLPPKTGRGRVRCGVMARGGGGGGRGRCLANQLVECRRANEWSPSHQDGDD